MRILALTLLLFALSGCCYRVTDPASGSVYYTKSVKQLRGGAVEFKDMNTDAKITLQSSEVKQVSFSEAEAAADAAEEAAEAAEE